MRIGVLGTGMVGTGLGARLVANGHDVRLGARRADNEKALAWTESCGERASNSTFADAAAFGDVVFLCTNGVHALDALALVGSEALGSKVLIDVTNALDFSQGAIPVVLSGNTDSIAERIQAAFPRSKVVKALNTVNWRVMAAANLVGSADHHLFLSGNDPEAKKFAATLIAECFGWKHFIDLGDVTSARGTEAYIAFWARVRLAIGTSSFNVKIVYDAIP